MKSNRADGRSTMRKDFAWVGTRAVHARAMSRQIAGEAGRMYPGNFDCESVKKNTTDRDQESRKSECELSLLLFAICAPPAMAVQSRTPVHGRKATSKTGK